MRKNAVIVFIGLMLSPITWWNDPFVNIPISYLAASLFAWFFPRLFCISFILFYWLTNILGIILLYMSGEKIIKARITGRNQILIVIVYTVLVLLLSIFGIIKPIALK